MAGTEEPTIKKMIFLNARYGAHFRGKRAAEAEGDAERREERSYGHGKAAAHPAPGKSGDV